MEPVLVSKLRHESQSIPVDDIHVRIALPNRLQELLTCPLWLFAFSIVGRHLHVGEHPGVVLDPRVDDRERCDDQRPSRVGSVANPLDPIESDGLYGLAETHVVADEYAIDVLELP